MTMAKIKPFCRATSIKIGYFDGTKVFPRSLTDEINALFLHNSHFCLIWKSESVSFNQAIKEMKDNFKIVDNYVTEENVNSHFKYDFIQKKIESHLTNFIVYNIEAHNTDRARPYCISFYRLINLAGRFICYLTTYEVEKCIKDTLLFDGDNFVGNAFDFLINFKCEEQKTINIKIAEYNSQLHAHNGSGFGTWIILNDLPCDKHIVDIIKNGKSIVPLNILYGYIQHNKKQTPQ